jgi:Flp pilus assembly protein TadD
MKGRVAAVAIALGLSAWHAGSLAEPYESDTSAAERDEDYAAGKKALAAKDWAEAVKRFTVAARRDPDSADLQNYLGYSYRNLKQYEPAFRHYRRAIELDPRHRGAHEYIGETYLQVGDLPNAERHLAALRQICLLPCDELALLEKAVAQFKAKK